MSNIRKKIIVMIHIIQFHRTILREEIEVTEKDLINDGGDYLFMV